MTKKAWSENLSRFWVTFSMTNKRIMTHLDMPIVGMLLRVFVARFVDE